MLFAQKLGLTNQQVHDTIISSVNPINGSKTISAGAGGRVNFLMALNSVSPPTSSGVTGLYNTGVDNNGVAVSDSSVDAHYALVSTPSGSGTAYVTQQHFPIQSGVWLLDTATSKWVSPHADEQQQQEAPGNYAYQTTFTISGDPTTVKITGQVAADDAVSAIILNGVTVATNVPSAFNAWSAFTLTSGLQSGTNTLKFVVRNGGTSANPSGFRCEMSANSTGYTPPSLPAAPTNLQAASGNAAVTLTWNASANATSYNIKRGTSLSGPFVTVATLQSQLLYTDGGTNFDGSNVLANGTTYYYVVTALNSAGESANSNVASATPTSGVPQATITGLYNTGVDNNGVAVSDSSVDAHYALVSTPSGSGTAYVTQQHLPIQSGVWLLDTATSKWVSPHADEQQQQEAPGNYTYQTTFTISGDPTTVKITGQVAGDDAVSAIILNGVTVATNVPSAFNAWSAFTLTSGLQSGTNTLKFVVRNGGTSANPSGFRCEMSGGSK